MISTEQRLANAAAQRRWRARNPEKVAARNKAWSKENPKRKLELQHEARERNRLFLIEAKSKPCVDCDTIFPSCVMDFDHVRGEKRDGVGPMAGHGFSIETLKAEIAKCDLVCANCHRLRTWKRGTYEEMSVSRKKAA